MPTPHHTSTPDNAPQSPAPAVAPQATRSVAAVPPPRHWRWATPLALLAVLAGCAAPRYTVDDGRAVNPKLLQQIEQYGLGERALRPAIARSAQLQDPDCDRQWELPISVTSSQDWQEDDRVAWVRALGVDERITVVAAAPGVGLRPGDKLVEVDGEEDDDATELLQELAEMRDWGRPFAVKTATGKNVTLTPFEVCRGYTRLAPPNTPTLQDYHWLMSYHPLEVAQAGLSDDEALWTVLWTQGVSEEGGVRMKGYHYGTQILSSLYTIATLATGLQGAALAADQAIKTAQQAAAQAATDLIKQQLIDQAKEYATRRLTEEVGKTVQGLTQAQIVSSMEQVAKNKGLLWGVSRVAATAFDEADAWAYQRMKKLGADPLAVFGLHQKLLERGLLANALALDPDRMTALQAQADKDGLAEEVVARLKGTRPESLTFASTEMPLASARTAFSYEDSGSDSADPYAYGLVEALLGMPAASGRNTP